MSERRTIRLVATVLAVGVLAPVLVAAQQPTVLQELSVRPFDGAPVNNLFSSFS